MTTRPVPNELYRLMDQADAELQSGAIDADDELRSYLEGVRDALQWALGLQVAREIAVLQSNAAEAGEALVDRDGDLWEGDAEADAYRLALLHDGARPTMAAKRSTLSRDKLAQLFGPLR